MAQVLDSLDAIKAFVGQPAVSGEPLVVDQEMIDAFANVTRDRQWIHTDSARAAAESPFKATIAHGLLTLSLLTAWYNECFEFRNRKMALNYGFDKIRFTGAVPSGSRLTGGFELERVEDIAPGEVRCFWRTNVHIAGAVKPVMVATWITQVRF
jgi:acyl dehydratase